MTVLLATCADLPDGEPGAAVLDAELAERGIDAAWVRWDDPAVDWAGADLVAVRSTWDYAERHTEFLDWARSLDQARLLNGADVFEWNHDKRYLLDLDDLPSVPTAWVTSATQLVAAVDGLGTAVVKPAVGAGGECVVVLQAGIEEDDAAPHVERGPVVVQPLVESIHTVGEVSVHVLDGRLTQRFDKLPGAGDVRVNEEHGGRVRAVELGDVDDLVLRAYDAMTRRFGRPMDYLRVDLLHWEGQWVVSELELIEPGLYLDVSPANAGPFADLLQSRLAPRPESRPTR
jgi:glutathione synthase/RimK-type ligase-like ATP-grasp enzyme